jgi:hypothetical protein
MTVSRKKYQEALRVLKAACKHEALPWTQRIRAAELILMVYGVLETPESKRDKRAVKELVTERAFERAANEQIRQAVTQRVMTETERDAERVAMQQARQNALRYLESLGQGQENENNEQQ